MEPSPSFLYSKETRVLAAHALIRGCLAVKKGKRENERKREAYVASLIEYQVTPLQSLVWGVLYHQTDYKLPTYPTLNTITQG